jgi:hypothetical protein
MQARMCPVCKSLRNLSVTTASRAVTDKQGNTTKVTTRTYHCETCGGLCVR